MVRGPSRRRWMPPRAEAAAAYLQAFVLSGVASVLLTRAYLQATNYPQLGGGGLHIAHVLWGGLLMAAGLAAALVFLGGAARMTGAILGGLGFGLFIDEVGKFVTVETDYFYAPAAGIIYGVFALLVVITQAVRGRTRLIPAERTANALDAVVGGSIGGLTERRRSEVLRLARGSGAQTEAGVARLLDAVPRREPPPPRFWQPWLDRARRFVTGLTAQRWLVSLVVIYLVAEPALTLIGVLLDGVTGELDQEREWGACSLSRRPRWSPPCSASRRRSGCAGTGPTRSGCSSWRSWSTCCSGRSSTSRSISSARSPRWAPTCSCSPW